MSLTGNTVRSFLPLFLVLTSATALADAPTNVSTGLTLTGSPLAAHGYDVVSFFVDGKPTLGDAKFSEVYEGATYRFVSDAPSRPLQEEPAEVRTPVRGLLCLWCFGRREVRWGPAHVANRPTGNCISTSTRPSRRRGRKTSPATSRRHVPSGARSRTRHPSH